MSKPVSNLDVEGVLSSVRRLVSDNKSQDTAARSSDRLILSPKQRVSASDVLRLKPADAVHLPQQAKSDDAVGAQVEDAEIASPATDAAPAQQEATPEGLQAGGGSKDAGSGKPAGDALMAKIAALETAIAKTAGQWEPDGVSRDAYAGTQASGMAWPERSELAGTGVAVDGAEEAGDLPHAELDDDQIMDEDTLRELVAEIVRAELQGALGERITRNVRKMVRREIHRALAARDLE